MNKKNANSHLVWVMERERERERREGKFVEEIGVGDGKTEILSKTRPF